MHDLTWHTINQQADALAERWRKQKIRVVYGVPMGGMPVAMLVAKRLDTRLAMPDENMGAMLQAEAEGRRVLVVDDLVDTGRTLMPYAEAGLRVDALYRKPYSPAGLASGATMAEGWLRFPWESASGPEDAVVRLLQHIGDDPTREGLRDTPRRVVKAMREMTDGLQADPAAVLGTTFTEPFEYPVWVKGIRFTSLCEHHLLPFSGTCVVGYTPAGRVVGLSKIPRLVEVFARRPQLQEQMCRQIADTLAAGVGALGVGVGIKAHHSCMGCRGIRQPDAEMVTVCMRGSWQGDPEFQRRLEDWA